jgi:hypothetical protein
MSDINLINKIYPKDKKNILEQFEKSPVVTPPIVTLQDVENKYLKRYFVRPSNHIDYVSEIDERQYSDFKTNPRFITAMVKWRIVGKKDNTILSNGVTSMGVRDTNKESVRKADLTFGGIHKYITDYTEYWQSEG